MRYLGVCLIAKNEERYLEEWLFHHVLAGVERFIIYDNAQHPVLETFLSEHISEGLVEVVHWPFETAQLNVYQHCLSTYGAKFKWLGFWDSDEFVVPMDPCDIRGVLCDYEEFAGLAISSVLYGSSGHLKSPGGLQVENFTERVHPDQHIKTILQPEFAQAPLTPHHFRYKPGAFCVSENGLPVPGPTAPHTSSRIKLNHYFYRSQEDWCAKMERGLAHPLADGSSYRLDQFFEHLSYPRIKDDSMSAWGQRIRDLEVQGAAAAARLAGKWAGLSGEKWQALLAEKLVEFDKALAAGNPVGAELAEFFTLLPCYNPGNPYVCNILSMFYRETGRMSKAWDWIKRSLMLDPTPEAYCERIFWHKAHGDHDQAARVKEWLRVQLEISGQMTPAWQEVLAD
jgi:hypothetical protein